MAKNIFSIIIVSIFACIAGFPLLYKGLIPTHDGEYHIVRFNEFYKTFSNGVLYPRWAEGFNNGFGIPLFNFVYPLPNYVAAFLHFFGTSFIDSFKLQMFLALIVGGIFFYLWTKEFWGRLGGIVSSVFYTFSPYHFVDIYIRGSVGEVWALAFFPAFLWAYTKFVKSERKVFFIFSSIFLALIIFSHNILALMFFFFCLSYISLLIYRSKNKKYLILNTLCLILLGLGLSAIFWLPALYETKYVTGLQIFDVASHFPDLYQLLIPSWGSGFSGAGLQQELSYQIGVANLLALFLSLIVIILQIRRKNKKLPYTLFFFFSFIFVLFLMLKMSLPIWNMVPFMNYFQFPWRLLSIEILLASFLAGSIFSLGFSTRIKIVFAIFLISLSFLLGIGYTNPAYYHYRDDNYYLTRSNFMDGTNSPGNVFNTIYFNNIAKKEKEKTSFLEGKGTIYKTCIKSERYSFRIRSESVSKIRVNTAYFPGWEVKINKKISKIYLDKNGLFNFYLPKGERDVEVYFTNTLVRNLGVFISLLSLSVILFLFGKVLFVTIKK